MTIIEKVRTKEVSSELISNCLLNLIRIVSGLAVVSGHARANFLVNFGEIESGNLLHLVIYFTTSLGHEAVLIFFVLSGYLIGSNVFVAHLNDTWSWTHFFSRRLTRLYVVLIPALVIGFVWDRLGMEFFGKIGNYYGGETRGASIDVIDLERDGAWGPFIGNLLFLQTLFISPFGTNTALWSLSYEWWFYISFALLAAAWYSDSIRARGFFLLFFCAIFAALGVDGRQYLYMWMAGAVVAVIRVFMPGNMKRQSVYCAGVFFAFCVMGAKIANAPALLTDWILVGSFSLLLFSIVSCRETLRSKKVADVAKFGASFTYALYLTHLPVIFFIQSALLGNQRMQPDLEGVLVVSGVILFVIIYAMIFSRFTEARTESVRIFFGAKFREHFGIKL
jgi:peptidoglycan/LPS O-acetylase OafA/YrhL